MKKERQRLEQAARKASECEIFRKSFFLCFHNLY